MSRSDPFDAVDAGTDVPGPKHPLIDRLLERRARHRQRSRLYRFAFTATGALVTFSGVVMRAVPGPAFVVIPAGLAMLAMEFEWAERRLVWAILKGEQAREAAATASPARKALAAAATNRRPHRLHPGAEERVRCATDQHPRTTRRVEHLPRVIRARGERLLRVDMLARRDRLQRDFGVPVRRRDTKHDIDRGVRQQRLGAARLQPVLALGGSRVEVGARDEVHCIQARPVVEVGGADRPAADQTDAERVHAGCARASTPRRVSSE
jgi:hypothetical protein